MITDKSAYIYVNICYHMILFFFGWWVPMTMIPSSGFGYYFF